MVFLNNDAVPEPGWLAALVAAIDGAPEDVVSVGGRIISIDGKRIDFIGGVMTFDGHALQNGFRMEIGTRREPEAGEELLFACGGNMISRRTRLLQLGGFDDDFFAYLEDVDFGWRTWISGARVLFEPRATVRHHSSATSSRLGDFERGVLFERNALQTVLKNYENLRESAGAILYAYVRRLHHYATTRNANAGELTRGFGERGRRAAPSLMARIRRRLGGSVPPLATLDDPLTTMQFRAFDWIVRNESRIDAKRTAVQSMRKRSDQEIFAKFPLHFVPTYAGDEELMSSPLFRLLRSDLRSVDRVLADIIAR